MKKWFVLAAVVTVATFLAVRWYSPMLWPPGPQSEPGLQVEASELVLFPEAVLDFTISDRCATYIQEHVSYAGTKQEIADRQEELRRQLQLPTRFISTARSDAHNWLSEIVRGFDNPDAPGTAPACSDDAERLEVFQAARSGSNLWSRREDAVHRWWNCEVYDQEPPPTPDARTVGECNILREWIPASWLPPADQGIQ